MKRAILIFLALLVVLSFYMVIPSSVHASDGGGQHIVKVGHVKMAFQLKSLSVAQLKALRSLRHRPSSTLPKVIAADACAAHANDYNCDGQDPLYQGCRPSASIVASYTPFVKIGNSWEPIGTAFLKWSDNCESNWAYGNSGYNYYDGSYYTYHFVLDVVKVVRNDGLTEEYDQTTDTEGWSNMVYAPVRTAKACIRILSWATFPGGGGGGVSDTWYCTGLY